MHGGYRYAQLKPHGIHCRLALCSIGTLRYAQVHMALTAQVPHGTYCSLAGIQALAGT